MYKKVNIQLMVKIKLESFLNVSAGLQQDSDHLLVTASARVHQRRVARAGLGVHVGAVRDQKADDVGVASGGGLH